VRDLPANRGRKKDGKKWIVNLKHYDPSVDYSNGDLLCPGIDLETYPELKTMPRNELVIVTGTVADVGYCRVVLFDAQFEFSGKRITDSKLRRFL